MESETYHRKISSHTRHMSHFIGQPERLATTPLELGLSGAELLLITDRYTTPGGAHWYTRRIQKRIAARSGWLGALSNDTQVREVALWTSGLLSHLPATIATGVFSADAETMPDGAHTGTLVMRDLRGHLLRDRHGRLLPDPPLTPPGTIPPIVLTILDHLAQLHAAYWENPHLDDPATGLMGAHEALLLLAPERLAARVAAGDTSPYLPLALAGWEEFFRLAAPEDAATLKAVLHTPDTMLTAINKLPRTLVHGDIWGPNLGLLPATQRAPRQGTHLLLLDWALATAGPATYDPLWLCGTWHVLHPPRVLAAYRARLQRRLASHGVTLSAATWRALADAGYLRTTLTCGEALARSATDALPGAGRRRMQARVRWWAARAARAAQRLSKQTIVLDKAVELNNSNHFASDKSQAG